MSAVAGLLRRFEHFRDRESPPSYSWVTTAQWVNSFPLVLTVSTKPLGWDAVLPEPILQIFEHVYARIDKGLVLRPGTVIDCGVSPPWGPYPRALVCVPVTTIPSVPLEPDTLALVGLHASELEAMAHVGKGRVLAHLGHYDEMPGYGRTCSWKRPPLADRLGLDQTELTRIKTVRASDWCVVSKRAGLTLKMTEPGDHRMAVELTSLAPGDAVAFLLDPAWEVRAMPPWPTPPEDQERPAVLGAWSQAGDGTGIQDGASPAFLALAVGDEDRVESFEDGLLMWLKSGTMAKLGEALVRRQTFDHDFPDHTVLRVRVVRAKAAPAKVDDKELLPERAAVPGLPSIFAPGDRWQTFTTPFKRVYPGVKK